MAKMFNGIRKKKKPVMTLENYVLAREMAKELTEKDYTSVRDLWRNEVWQRKW